VNEESAYAGSSFKQFVNVRHSSMLVAPDRVPGLVRIDKNGGVSFVARCVARCILGY